jgi:hypothetical protein
MSPEIIASIIGGISLIIAGIIAYLKDARFKKLTIENKEIKLQLNDSTINLTDANIKIALLDKLGNFVVFNEIRQSVDRIFENTSADRFLVLFAINGTRSFKTVSVIFEQHKHPDLKINAIIRYRDVQIDDEYRRLLRNVEEYTEIDLDVTSMPNQLLKDFYTIEQVTHSKVKFLHRKHVDEKNDIVMYCSIAKHSPDPFDNLENAIIKTEIEGCIQRVITEYI